MAKYRKKPVVIDAFQLFYIDDLDTFYKWAKEVEFENYISEQDKNLLIIDTLEGDMLVSSGDFIIKGIHGEFYSCKPDNFEKTYEKVKEELTDEEKIQKFQKDLEEYYEGNLWKKSKK